MSESIVENKDGYIIRRKKDATGVSGISFCLPKDAKVFQREIKNEEMLRRESVDLYISHSVLPWLKIKCDGMSDEEKRTFLKNKFGVSHFSELNKLEIKQLREVVNG